MGILLRLLGLAIIIAVIYFGIKSSAKRELQETLDDINKEQEHQNEVQELNKTIMELRCELEKNKAEESKVD